MLSAGSGLNSEQGAKYLHALKSSQVTVGMPSCAGQPGGRNDSRTVTEPLEKDMLWGAQWFGKAGWEAVWKIKAGLWHPIGWGRWSFISIPWRSPSSGDVVPFPVSLNWEQLLVWVRRRFILHSAWWEISAAWSLTHIRSDADGAAMKKL